ncbi:MAG TPA: hypothetical protein EYH31_02725 [Anaerolineae bacterium]|nr:hypothetical protein [Anaerolineae bacterium]
MKLDEYPRPKDDNGIGIHWSPGNPGAPGIGELRDKWLSELKALGVKWVKMLHVGGVEFAELLLENDIMPIVRLYRPQPNSTDASQGTLQPEQIEYVKRYVAVGVHYFEFNNEPELPSEWEGNRVPPNAEEVIARHTIRDMETILKLGGYPAVPATAIGTKWDLVGQIVAQGREDLFDEPVWLAVHNYAINHPLDYPYDSVNQEGTPLSPEEYDRLGLAAWRGEHWGHRSLEFVNQQRTQGKNPGDTVHDDPSCWLAYQRVADLCYEHLGRYLPILSTENGVLPGEDDDPRYPTITPEIHRDRTLEMCRIMMGTSQKFDPAPDYYFCTAFWLMGSSVLRAPGWDQHAWYLPNRRLPIVAALQAEPKKARGKPTSDGNGGGSTKLPQRLLPLRQGTVPAPAMEDISAELARHPTERYPIRKADAIQRLIIHHTVTKSPPTAIAKYQVDRYGWPGIGYHFVIMEDGTIYQTQHLNVVSRHTLSHNADSVGVALSGDFSGRVPGEPQMAATAALCAYLLDQLQIEPGPKTVVGRNELEAVASPGDQWLKGAHWKETLLAQIQELMGAVTDGLSARLAALEAAVTQVQALHAQVAGSDGALPSLRAELEALGSRVAAVRERLEGS